MEKVLLVSTNSNPTAVAGALAAEVRIKGKAELKAIGAGAVNQAIKAIAIARGFVAPVGIEIVVTPSFEDIDVDGDVRTAMRFIVEPR